MPKLKLQILPNGNYSIIKNDDEDIMPNWKSCVKELIKKNWRLCRAEVDMHTTMGSYVLTNTSYGLILEMEAEMVVH